MEGLERVLLTTTEGIDAVRYRRERGRGYAEEGLAGGLARCNAGVETQGWGRGKYEGKERKE